MCMMWLQTRTHAAIGPDQVAAAHGGCNEDGWGRADAELATDWTALEARGTHVCILPSNASLSIGSTGWNFSAAWLFFQLSITTTSLVCVGQRRQKRGRRPQRPRSALAASQGRQWGGERRARHSLGVLDVHFGAFDDFFLEVSLVLQVVGATGVHMAQIVLRWGCGGGARASVSSSGSDDTDGGVTPAVTCRARVRNATTGVCVRAWLYARV